MAQVVGNNQVKLDNGKVITASQGGWYDGQQFWGGTLSEPGQINRLSNQQGAGQLVSEEVIAQTDPRNVEYIRQRRQEQQLPASQPAQYTPPTQKGFSVPSAPSSGAGIGDTALGAPNTPNLPDLYQRLYQDSGITERESRLRDLESKFLEARNKISDNPFLSASMVDQRLKRLQGKYEQETSPLRNEIATQKADIETQLNLQTKQFDINSESAKLALSYFNTLLESGALDNASGDDIANITRSTGLSSSMIYSAVNAQRQKDVDTQTISWDDGTNQGFAVINSRTGEVISNQSVASSKPTSSGSGSGGFTNSQRRDVTGTASRLLRETDEQYRTTGGKAKQLEFEQDYGGDKRLSLQEYELAVQRLVEETGIDPTQADDILTQQMQSLGYVKWRW